MVYASASTNPLKSSILASWKPTSNSEILPQLLHNQVSPPIYLKQLDLNRPIQVPNLKLDGKSEFPSQSSWGDFQQGKLLLPVSQSQNIEPIYQEEDLTYTQRQQQQNQKLDAEEKKQTGGSGTNPFWKFFIYVMFLKGLVYVF